MMTGEIKNPHQPLQRTPMLVVGSQFFYERAFPEKMKDRFELHFFDHKGFVQNQQLKESAYPSLDTIAADIEAFRLEIGLDKFLLFGHSGHAYMVLEYAKAFPERILGLVLCACSPDLSPESHQAAESYFHETADRYRQQLFGQDMAGLRDKIYTEPSLRFIHFVLSQKAKNWFDPTYDASWLWKDVPTHLPTLDFVWGKLFREYRADLNLDKVIFPVLFLQGKYDFVAGPHSRWEGIAAKMPKVTTVIFEKSGHYPMVEQADEFLNGICSWAGKLHRA
jgi:proline iminopeptidase